MSIEFPSIFPNPEGDFSGELDSSTERTQMDTGRYRQESRYTRENRNYSVSWMFDDFQFGMWQSWVLYKLANGSRCFNINLPTGGEGLKTVQARLVNGKYTWKYSPVLNWTVQATIEVEDAKVWTEDIYDILLFVGSLTVLESAASNSTAAADALHTLIHVTMPANN